MWWLIIGPTESTTSMQYAVYSAKCTEKDIMRVNKLFYLDVSIETEYILQIVSLFTTHEVFHSFRSAVPQITLTRVKRSEGRLGQNDHENWPSRTDYRSGCTFRLHLIVLFYVLCRFIYIYLFIYIFFNFACVVPTVSIFAFCSLCSYYRIVLLPSNFVKLIYCLFCICFDCKWCFVS